MVYTCISEIALGIWLGGLWPRGRLLVSCKGCPGPCSLIRELFKPLSLLISAVIMVCMFTDLVLSSIYLFADCLKFSLPCFSVLTRYFACLLHTEMLCFILDSASYQWRSWYLKKKAQLPNIQKCYCLNTVWCVWVRKLQGHLINCMSSTVQEQFLRDKNQKLKMLLMFMMI